MLKNQIESIINEQAHSKLLDVEKTYAQKHELLDEDATVEAISLPFDVIERCHKETEELLAEETASFLTKPVHYLKEHANEFMYVTSERLDVIRVDSFALEFDGAFGVYSAMFGLRLQKKYSAFLHSYLTAHLQHKQMTYSAVFSGEDGLWEVNLALDALDGFSAQQPFDEVLTQLYCLVFGLLEELEASV
ncbi:branched-chain amino acid aminotransferase [Lysinibacillus sp. FSL K6-3209]|uniref:branched-chain amino acid aminotransferase n=1 Tax=Lysinibacillus sp. FSL K6-3209 TaxID=2921497 RepID=UPI0030DB57D3